MQIPAALEFLEARNYKAEGLKAVGTDLDHGWKSGRSHTRWMNVLKHLMQALLSNTDAKMSFGQCARKQQVEV